MQVELIIKFIITHSLVTVKEIELYFGGTFVVLSSFNILFTDGELFKLNLLFVTSKLGCDTSYIHLEGNTMLT